MAQNDIQVVDMAGASVRRFVREDRTTSSESATLKPGDFAKIGTSNDVLLVATGDPEAGTDRVVGLVTKESTETSTADGFVDILVPVPGKTVFRAKATTAANLTDAILYNSVAFDVTTGTITVDEDETDDPNVHGLQIVSYDADADTVDFVIKDIVAFTGAI